MNKDLTLVILDCLLDPRRAFHINFRTLHRQPKWSTYSIFSHSCHLSMSRNKGRESEDKKNSSMKDKMQESKPDEGSGGTMQGMHGMMGMMMKMMDQCNEMMKAMQQQRENARPTRKN
jgi:hypothetical protein